jgi:protein-S-isoprenylcysteine O-methyltransferase Ste14
MARPRWPRARAALGSLVFLLVAPGVVAGLLPWTLTGWRAEAVPLILRTGGGLLILRTGGGLLILAGLAFLLHAFARFVLEGIGTPAPVAPTRHLVVGGAYRHVRNPMYLAVGSIIVGQALLLGQPGLLAYAATFGAVVFAFVRGYEEPALAHRFGPSYEEYRRAVPGWLPRLHPWEGGR